MSQKELKREIEYLKSIFPKNQSVFRILSGSLDDLTCSFTDECGKEHKINCNFTSDMYPSIPPIWCTDSEVPQLTDLVEKVNTLASPEHLLFQMTKTLAVELFKLRKDAIPKTILDSRLSFVDDEKAEEIVDQEMEDEKDEDDFVMDDDDGDLESICFEPEKESEEANEVGEQNYSQLQRLRGYQRQEYLNGRVSGSVQATDRLMKELTNIYKSDSYKANLYTLQLKDDSNVYDWFVKFKGFDKESHLYKDLQKLWKSDNKTDHICLNITYSERFPMEPPFVRVCYPVITGGYVLTGGAICMELLTPQGWSSAYSIEALIMQISATLVKGKARIDFNNTQKVNAVYSLVKAQHSYKTMVQIHEKSGWFTPPKGEG